MWAAVRLSAVRLRALLGKEFLQLLRDPRMRFFVVVPPLLQLLAFGYAATFDVKQAHIAVVDEAHTIATRDLAAALAATGNFYLRYVDTPAQAVTAIDRGDVRAIVRFGPDFDREPVMQIIADGSDSNSAQLVVGQVSQAVRAHAAQRAPAPPLTIEERAWYNENLDDRNFFVPGIMANVVLVATMILTAMTVVRERELGTLERLLVTPVARIEFIVAKVLPVACVGLFDVLLVTVVAVGWFEVPFLGSVAALLLGSSLFLMSTLGMGLLISAFSRTQQQAMLMAMFFIMPFIVLSGFAFPVRNMPESVQLLAWINPLHYFLIVVRDVFLKGSGITAHGFEYMMMAFLGVAALLVSTLRLRAT